MLLCGGSGSGKTNLLCHMLTSPLLNYDQIHLYAKTLEQEKHRNMIDKMNEISQQVGYDVLVCYNDNIIPVSDIQNTVLQRVVIFDDFFCEKTKSLLLIISYKDIIKLFSNIFHTMLLWLSKTHKNKLQSFCIV